MKMIQAYPASGTGALDPDNSAMPHVLLVVDQFPKTLGGGERIVLKLAALLPAYGFRASILTFSIHPECSALDQVRAPVYLLPLQRTYDLTALRAAFALRRFLKKEQVQIVQTFFESSDIWAGFVARTVPGVKLVWSRRDMGILRTGKHRTAYRWMSGFPDVVFAVSEQVRQYTINVDTVEPRRVITVHNGLELAEWHDESQPNSHRRNQIVVTVGNIRRVKGHDLFVRAAAVLAVQFPDASFHIAGDVLEQHYFEELQQLVQQLGLAERFHFDGGVSSLRTYLSRADIFVLPSRSEGFSNAIVEAMAAALPVVATDVGGNAEAVEDGISGTIVPPEDFPALSSAIAELLAQPARARQMGLAGRKIVLERFTMDAMMQRIVKAYRELLAPQP